jgi:hypothetical protein
MIEKEQCRQCSNEAYIENRTRMLCKECNHIRIHGETIKERAIRKGKEYAERKKQKGATKIPQVSSKQKGINKEMTAMKQMVSNQAQSENGFEQCAGCMRTDIKPDKSHILSVKQRPDLQLDYRNIELLCRKCHEKWESGDILQMSSLLCFQKDMRFIFDMDGTKFQKIMFKLEDNKEKVQRIAYLYDELSSLGDYFCNKFENGKERCNRQCGKCRNV